MSPKFFLNKALKFLNPAAPTGGLEINDNTLRYFSINKPELAVSVRLAPGIIVDGVIKDEPAFAETLKKFHSQLGDIDNKSDVVAIIRSSAIYAQVFSLPPLPKEKISEAVSLNLSMVSPLKSGESYSDAEPIGRGPSGEGEYLGAFAPRELIDKYMRHLRTGGFSPMAIEFSGLSIARAIREFSSYDVSEPAILVQLNPSGADFFVIKNGQLVFQYLSPWENLLSEGGRQISLDLFLQFLRREISRVSNFYSGKWGGSLTNILAISDGMPAEAGLAVIGLNSYRELGLSWLTVLGAAQRAHLPRKKDIFISLAPVGTEEEFAKNRFLHFIRFWRNAIAATLAFLLVVFIGVDSYLAHINSRLEKDLKFGISPELLKEVSELEAEAREFNRVAALATAAKAESQDWSPVLAEFRRLAGGKVTLRRVLISSPGNILITGLAPSELAAITFKNSLSQSPLFKEVNLPLANITPDPSGGVSFQMTIK